MRLRVLDLAGSSIAGWVLKEKQMPMTRVEALRERERIMTQYEQAMHAGGQVADARDIARGDLLQLQKRLAEVPEAQNVEVDIVKALGVVSRQAGDLDRALTYFGECEALARKLDDDDQLAQALANRANVLRDQGKLDEAAEALAGTFERLKRAFDPALQTSFLCNLANLQIQRGRLDEAIDAATEAERLCQETGQIKTLRFARFNLALAHGERSDLAVAAERFASCLQTAREVHGALPSDDQVVGAIIQLASRHTDRPAANAFLNGLTERLEARGHDGLAKLIDDAASQVISRTMAQLALMGASQRDVPAWLPVTEGPLARRLAFGCIEAQYRDATDKLANRSYWRNVGQDVMDATLLARAALETVTCSNPDDYFVVAIERIEAAHDEYRDKYEDEDGFGSATFAEILRDLHGHRESSAIRELAKLGDGSGSGEPLSLRQSAPAGELDMVEMPKASSGLLWVAVLGLLVLVAVATYMSS